MTHTELQDCRTVCISAPEEEVLNACREMGVRGYLIDGETGLVLMTSIAEAQRVVARFGVRAVEGPSAVQLRELPPAISRLSRKTSTSLRGAIVGFDGESMIGGWVYPDLAPDRRIRVFRGKTQIAEVTANLFRPDLFEAGIGDGIAGFSCRLPGLAGQGGDIEIRTIGGDVLARWAAPAPAPEAAAAAPARVATRLGAGEVPGPGAAGHYCVDLGGFSLDYYLVPGRSGRMVVFSPGFLDAKRFPYPYFQRMKWAQRLEDTCVFLTDPSLLLGDTQIGWFIGNRTTHYLPVVARYVETLAASLGTAPADLLFFGSSTGGFSSIGMAAHVRGARALAVNPQTNALKLHSPLQLANTLRSCLGVSSLVDAYRDYRPRLILSEMFRQLGHVPRMTIWQNFYDHYHVEHHLLPFLQEIKDLWPTEELDVRLAARPDEGHDPPDLQVIEPLFWP